MPFRVVFEVTKRLGSIVQTWLVAALDEPITPELLGTFIDTIEAPYRRASPLLHTTLVHTGEQTAGSLLREAARRGVHLTTLNKW